MYSYDRKKADVAGTMRMKLMCTPVHRESTPSFRTMFRNTLRKVCGVKGSCGAVPVPGAWCRVSCNLARMTSCGYVTQDATIFAVTEAAVISQN